MIASSVIKEYVEANFGFIGKVKCSLISNGVNDIYLVEGASQKYVLRLSRVDKNFTHTDEEFAFELEWLEFLNEHHIPVSYPIRQENRHLFGLIQAEEGVRYATLYSFAEGTTELNVERAYILGKSLAELHATSDFFETTLKRERLDIPELIDILFDTIKRGLGEQWKEEIQSVSLDGCRFSCS